MENNVTGGKNENNKNGRYRRESKGRANKADKEYLGRTNRRTSASQRSQDKEERLKW